MATEFSVPKAKRFPYQPRSPVVARLMQSCAFILAVNWCLQGMRGMDRKELSFRLSGQLIVTALLASLAGMLLPRVPALILALVIAHTLSFTLNGQVWVCARYCRSWHGDPQALEQWLQATAAELRTLSWLREAVCIGSRGDRGLVSGDRADLDLRLVFPQGYLAWLRINLLLLRLRTRAFLGGIPLDLYAYDSPGSLGQFDQRERLLVLLDRDGRMAGLFPHRVVPWPG